MLGLSISVVLFSLHQGSAQFKQTLLVLLELQLLSFVQFVLLLKLGGWLNLTRSCVGSDVEEIDVGFQISLLHQFDRLGLSIHEFLQSGSVGFLEIGSTPSHILFVLGESIIL